MQPSPFVLQTPSCKLPVLFRSFLLVLVLVSLSWSSANAGPIFIFSDGFEGGNAGEWTNAVGLPPAPTVFRFSDLDLRDPHLFIDVPVFGCSDFTDTDVAAGLVPAFNPSIEDLITLDGDSDGFLDASFLVLPRPLLPMAVGERLDLAGAQCSEPISTTFCNFRTSPTIGAYDGLTAGLCLGTEPGTTSGYSPSIAEPMGPCLVSDPQGLSLSLGGIPVPLEDAQVAATFVGDPVTGLVAGLLRGFLSETAAAAVLLPADLPIVGGMPLTVLLPGGVGSCVAPPGDLDTHNSESGWWFYLNFTADEVGYNGV